MFHYISKQLSHITTTKLDAYYIDVFGLTEYFGLHTVYI